MTEVKDDPREVLALLNSLGYVGITAPQLKAFMKDLKLHRKIKQREQQQWKEETREKILSRQQQLYREILKEHKKEMHLHLTDSTISSESSNVQYESSFGTVRVKIKCIPDDKENQENDTFGGWSKSGRSEEDGYERSCGSWAEEFRRHNFKYNNVHSDVSSSLMEEPPQKLKSSKNRYQVIDAVVDRPGHLSTKKPKPGVTPLEQPEKYPMQSTAKTTVRSRPASARDPAEQSEHSQPKSSAQDQIPLCPPPSRSTVRSQPKSFIRPWRLQPEVQKTSSNKRSDPVALYQKYQEEWKQLSLPGVENHAGVRWAMREKMLGLDPNPRPIPLKSFSMTTMKRR